MDRDNFYITLFSNASQDIYPYNKIAAFTTQLAQPIRLDPSEYVGGGIMRTLLLREPVASAATQFECLRERCDVLRSHSAAAYRHR